MVGWLVAHRDPATGLWGSDERGLRQPVNGTYRAGTDHRKDGIAVGW